MPNDVITINAIVKELQDTIKKGKIEKIYQPEADEITMHLRANGTWKQLVISANPNFPRSHLSSQKKENSVVAPAFCMLLRKYLTGAVIENIEIYNCDRIIRFTISARNELLDKVCYYLFAELMGRYSNIILTKSDYTIVDAIKRIHFDVSTTRFILPNLKYENQPQNKISLDDVEKLSSFFENTPDLTPETIMSGISGIAKDTAKEIIFDKKRKPMAVLTELYNINELEAYSPCVRYLNVQIKDFFIRPYSSKEGEYKAMPSLNEAVDLYYSLYDADARKQSHAKEARTIIKRLLSKIERRVAEHNSKLIECKDMDKLRHFGELILANIYLLKKGDEKLICVDYDTNTEISITLDTTLFPQQNASAYFKKYSKLKKAQEIAYEQLEKLELQRVYLLGIESSLQNITLKQEYDEILAELHALGGLKKPASPLKQKTKASAPLHFIDGDYHIYVGKNNIQNVEVTFKIASSNDLWFHAKKIHGSHVIIKGEKPPIQVIEKAAELCAFYSGCSENDKFEIDYTLKKFVKKIPDGMTGMVIYTNYKTLLVSGRSKP